MSSSLLFILVVAQLPERALDLRPDIAFRVSTGTEWDTNAQRAIEGPSTTVFSQDIVGDGLVRLLANADAKLAITALDRIDVEYDLGAKRFFSEATEDLLVHNLNLSTTHWLTDFLYVQSSGRARASRIRSGIRDYSLLMGDLGFGLIPIESVSLSVRGRGTSFDFTPNSRFSYTGPGLYTSLSWQIIRPLSVSAFFDHDWRGYDSNVLVQVFDEDGMPRLTEGGAFVYTFCDGTDDVPLELCTPTKRDDTMITTGMRVAYRSTFIVGGEATARLQRSSSEFENLDRFQLAAFGTFSLPLDLTFSFMGSLQLNRGASATQTQLLGEDDENQNRVEAQLSYAVSDALGIDLRYALYANEFETAAATFFRQTYYLGLSYHIDSAG